MFKTEKERERLLSIKAVLPNGKYDNVYEYKYIGGTEFWYCNACACPVMGFVFHHETGKRHSVALGNQNQDRGTTLQDIDESPLSIQIAPGEPVPPGFEGQVEKVALIQECLDAFNVRPLVALEYLLELRDYDATKEPTYLCILCDKKGDPRTVLTHLASYKHILQYLQKHFPTCYRALAPYMTKQYKRNWQTALHEIAEAIEKKFGRLKPMPVEADRYEKDPVQFLESIAKSKHFSELSGYTFEEYINKNELTKAFEEDNDYKLGYHKPSLAASIRKKSPSPPVVENPIKKIKMCYPTSGSGMSSAPANRRRSLSSMSSITSSDLSDYEGSENRKKDSRRRSPPRATLNRSSRSPFTRRFDRKTSPPKRDVAYNRDRLRERERERERERNLMPWQKSNYTRAKPVSSVENKPKPDKWDEYKKLCKAIDSDMERVYTQHKKNPEKHTQYNDEWKKFWNKRYKELQTEGKDVSSHDFKPEWIIFWSSRMHELHQEEIKSKKEALRKRLGLPDEPSPISFKIKKKPYGEHGKHSPSSNKPLPTAAMPDNDPEIIVIDDKDDESKSSRRSHSPWEDEPKRLRSKTSRDKSRDTSRADSRDRGSRDSLNRRSRERPPRSPRSRYSRSPKDRYDRSPIRRSRERSWDRDIKEIKEFRRERIRIMSELPWERDRVLYRNELPDCYKPPAVMRDVTREPVLTHLPPKKPLVVEAAEEDIEINVVAVLRLLTALEEKLGSLGPKVIDLLAQALAMEKNEANSSEKLLDNDINCVMFETVKEKLKGQLLAGFVEQIHERAFKNAIKKVAGLIYMAGERKKEFERNLPKVDPVKVPGVGTVDKAAIAKQIANALVQQNKTDVSQNELEQLINAVVGMAEASKASNKPMTTANFLEQLSKTGGSLLKPKIEPLPSPSTERKLDDKSIIKTEIMPIIPEKPAAASNMEGLSDSDLQTLLQNFKDLSTEEQHGLINYLKKLEAKEPDRVERLRKFVNLGGSQKDNSKNSGEEKKSSGRESPFSSRVSGANPTNDGRIFDLTEEVLPVKKYEDIQVKMPIDSDEEDYSFDDVAKAASKNVKEKEMEKSREIIEESMKFEYAAKEENKLDSTKSILSNLMNNINKSDGGNLLGLSVSSDEFTKTLNSIPVNMASLANIVGSVQNMTNKKFAPTPQQQQQNLMGFGGTLPQPQVFQTSSSQNKIVPFPQTYVQNRPNVSYPLDRNKISYPNLEQHITERFVGQQQDRFPDRFEGDGLQVSERFISRPQATERFGGSGPQASERFVPGPQASERFRGAQVTDRYVAGPQAIDRFGSGAQVTDRFGSGVQGADRFGSGTQGPDRFGSGAQGPDRFGSGTQDPDRFGSGAQGPDRFLGGQPTLDRYGSGQHPGDRFGGGPQSSDRFASGQRSNMSEQRRGGSSQAGNPFNPNNRNYNNMW